MHGMFGNGVLINIMKVMPTNQTILKENGSIPWTDNNITNASSIIRRGGSWCRDLWPIAQRIEAKALPIFGTILVFVLCAILPTPPITHL
jgi:hypothetical protein